MTTTFAERLRWSRYNGPAARKLGKVIGATILARRAGCAQSLISSLERQNAKGSDHANKFADTLGVDRNWLSTGDGLAPEGFDEAEAKRMREYGGERLLSIVHSTSNPSRPRGDNPRWVEEPRAEPEAPTRLASLQKTLMNDFMDFITLAGPGRAEAYLKLLQHVVETQSQAGLARENHS